MAYIASFAAPAFLVAFAILVWRTSSDRPLNRHFTTFTVIASVWATAVTAVHGGMYLTFWIPVSFAAGSLIPASFLAFMHAYAPVEGVRARRVLRVLLIISLLAGIAFSVLSTTTNLIVSEPTLSG